jgi:hypothetical protein
MNSINGALDDAIEKSAKALEKKEQKQKAKPTDTPPAA